MRVLLAEDEESLARGLKFLLERNSFVVDIVYNGTDALDFFHTYDYDAVVLDIMMPGMNGLEVLSAIRREGSSVPVMMLTARSEIEDRVKGLETGADDYLSKPFATQEFVARVRALVRRSGGYAVEVLKFGNACLNGSTFELSCGEKSTRLNNKEYQLAELFFRHPHFVFSANLLMDRVWERDSEANIDVVWTYIGFLRKKLRETGADVEIRTIRGSGYALEEIRC